MFNLSCHRSSNQRMYRESIIYNKMSIAKSSNESELTFASSLSRFMVKSIMKHQWTRDACCRKRISKIYFHLSPFSYQWFAKSEIEKKMWKSARYIDKKTRSYLNFFATSQCSESERREARTSDKSESKCLLFIRAMSLESSGRWKRENHEKQILDDAGDVRNAYCYSTRLSPHHHRHLKNCVWSEKLGDVQ